MAAHGALMPAWLRRPPPAGEPLGPAARRAGAAGEDAARTLSDALGRRLGAARVDLVASGREALRLALAHLARRSGRREVVVPAYTCFSVPSAVVAAGLRVRLVDVTPEGWIDPAALERLPLDEAVAVVVCNLFGRPEPIQGVLERARAAGAAVVDDAAQALGAVGREGPVGGRGDVGVLSFGRGKPLAALGGGALVWPEAPEDVPAPPAAVPGRTRARVAALAHDLALSPWVFPWIARLPGLHVGESRFEPRFPGGPMGGTQLALAAGALGGFDAALAARTERAAALAGRLRAEHGLEPLLAAPGEQGSYARLALLAPNERARDRALRDLATLGASPMYRRALDTLPELAPHRAGEGPCPGARELAARVLTVRTG